MIELSATHRQCDIARLLGVNRKTVNRVIGLAMQTGKVVRTPLVGNPRILNGLHLAVSLIIVDKQCHHLTLCSSSKA